MITRFTEISGIESQGGGWGYDGDEVCVWVDWNHDFDFYDAGETISVDSVPGNGPYTGSLTPPLDAILGAARLRVRIAYGSQGNEPCGTLSYGEVEDYQVVVDEFVCGDWNNDGLLDAVDVQAAYDYYINEGPAPTLGLIAGDFDGDGFFTIADLVAIIDAVNNSTGGGNCLGL